MNNEEIFLSTLITDIDTMRHIVAIHLALSKIFGDDKHNMKAWLNSKNLEWNGRKPIAVVLDGKKGMEEVLSYLHLIVDRGA